MSTITSQNWDGVPAPSVAISGWTVGTGWATTTAEYRSSAPNSIAVPITSTSAAFLTWNAQDTNSGNVQLIANWYFDSTGRGCTFGACVRGSATPLDASSTTQYVVEIVLDDDSGNRSVTLYAQISGTRRSLATVSPTSSLGVGWYQMLLTANGTSITVALIRGSDSSYLQTGGTFGSAVVNCLTVTDSSVRGAGYAGLYAYSNHSTRGSAVYSDDFLLSTAGSAGATGGEAALTGGGTLSAASASAGLSLPASIPGSAGSLPTAIVGLDASSVARSLAGSDALPTATAATGVGVGIAAATLARSTAVEPSPSVAYDCRLACGVMQSFGVFGAVSLQVSGAEAVVVLGLSSWGLLPAAGAKASQSGVVYNLYVNDGAGGPIDYSKPIATTSATSWTSATLEYPGDWKFGVRAYQLGNSLEEQNLDAAIELILDGSGSDVSASPMAPSGLRAIPRPAGAIRVEWGFHSMDRARLPLGFHIYTGTGALPDYTSPASTIRYVLGGTSYLCDLAGLVPGTTYTVGVRAYNAAGEETNTSTVQITPDATGPLGVDILTATPTANQGD